MSMVHTFSTNYLLSPPTSTLVLSVSSGTNGKQVFGRSSDRCGGATLVLGGVTLVQGDLDAAGNGTSAEGRCGESVYSAPTWSICCLYVVTALLLRISVPWLIVSCLYVVTTLLSHWCGELVYSTSG